MPTLGKNASTASSRVATKDTTAGQTDTNAGYFVTLPVYTNGVITTPGSFTVKTGVLAADARMTYIVLN
jgi:hypothetical protein